MTEHPTEAKSKQQLWSDTIADWKASGLPQKQYCALHQLTYSTFVYWRGRLKRLNSNEQASDKVRFLPVKLGQAPMQATLTLRINGRHSIEIHPGFDPVLLTQVVQVLEQAR